MLKIKSSVVSAIEYNQNNQTLMVELRNGGMYQYQNVTKNIFKNFLRSKSKGRYYSSKIVGKDFKEFNKISGYTRLSPNGKKVSVRPHIRPM